MDSVHSLIATQYQQERIAGAQAERLAKEVRQARSRRRRRSAVRLFRRPVVANSLVPRR
jgi:hypothetical protein